ncbi:hypothetical protein GCM10022254_01790 [Actinomadura meridiana]|uniref:Uncharacterized protein n=1 Tax=Actinomadura meridiana TaxID=559626 RepID=A0ABP8BRJ6_9ACTN
MAANISQTAEAQRLRLWALTQALKSHGYAVEVAESDPLLAVPDALGSPVLVRCDSRPDCDGELWFTFPGGTAIAPADDDHIPDVVVAIKGQLAAQADG